MSTEQHKKWGAPDFERYHSGKMTEAEMHALEKAALDDPFLEDALDGYAFTKTPVADISQLKEKLWPPEDVVTTPVIWYQRKAVSQLFKAAAVLIICGGLGWLIINKNNDQQGDTINPDLVAAKEKTTGPADSIASLYNLNDSIPAVAKLDNDQVNAILQQQQQMPLQNNEPTVAKPSGNDDRQTYTVESEELARNDNRAAEKAGITPPASKPAAAPVIKNALEEKIAESQAEKDRAAAKSNYMAKQEGIFNNAQATNQVRGRVVDNTGKPVPYAVLRNNADNRQSVQADADGNFVLNDVSGNNAVKIETNATGYDQASTIVNNNSSGNTIVLNQSQNVLSEVVTTGNAKKSRKENYQWTGKNTNITLKNAAPLEGWPYFYYVMNDSIVNNKILSAQRGRIVLQFDTDADGAVKNVVIKKSLNDDADNAALKLLYKSPVLKVKNNKLKGEATFKMGL